MAQSNCYVTKRTRIFGSLSSNIMRVYKKRSKSTEIWEGLKNSRVLWAKFMFLLRNPFKNGEISENGKLGSK